MNRKPITDLFDSIRAEEELKQFAKEKVSEYLVRNKKSRRYKLYPAIAACILISAVFSGGIAMRSIYFITAASVSIDVNPSVRLDINLFNRIIGTKAFNTEGESVLNAVPVLHKNYVDAVNMIIESAALKHYLSDDGAVAIDVSCRSKKRGTRISRELSECKSCIRLKNFSCHQSDPAMAAEAESLGISTGKYRAFLELKKTDPDIGIDEVKSLSMREIRDRINQSGEQSGEREPFPGNGRQHKNRRHSHGRNRN